MKIFALRHGETDANKEKKIQGHSINLGLNEAGKNQVRQVLPSLPLGITMILSSPLKRAHQSAEIVSHYLNVPIILRDELKEKNAGSLSGKTWEEVARHVGFDLSNEDGKSAVKFEEFGGESREDIKNRLTKLFLETKELYSHEKILIVTHAGIIHAMHRFLLEKTEVQVGNASIHEFDI